VDLGFVLREGGHLVVFLLDGLPALPLDINHVPFQRGASLLHEALVLLLVVHEGGGQVEDVDVVLEELAHLLVVQVEQLDATRVDPLDLLVGVQQDVGDL